MKRFSKQKSFSLSVNKITLLNGFLVPLIRPCLLFPLINDSNNPLPSYIFQTFISKNARVLCFIFNIIRAESQADYNLRF